MGTARTPVFKHALPHRGDGSAPHVPAADAPARLAALVEARRERLARVAWSPKSEPELVAAAEAHLAGIASPLGAAVALPLVRRLPGAGGPTDFRCAVDAWAVEHGLGFAVDAVMAMADINGLADRFDRPEPRRLPPGAPPRLGVDADSPATALRRLLVGVGDEEHADAVERIARGRTSVTNRAVAAFLVPDRSEWVDVACAETLRHHRSASAMLLCSIGGLDQLELVKALVNPAYMVEVRTAMATLAHRLGPASAPLLVQWSRWMSPGGKRAVLNVLAHLDSDAALVGLLGHADSASGAKALASAAERFPERAVRLFAIRLADWPRNDFLARRLRDVAQGHPEAVDAVLPRLPADARAAVERQRPAGADAGADGNGNGNGNVPDAPAGTLPPVLVDPPWQGKARKKLAAVGGLVAPFERRVIWAAGERERWLQEPGGFARGSGAATDWEVYRHYEGRTFAPNWAFQLAGAVPVELLLPALPQWELGAAPAAQIEDMRYAAARLELAVLPLLLTAARQQPGLSGGALTPFLDTEVAELLASWLARPRTPQADAVEYFELHGVDAARLLVPAAVGRRGPERKGAEAAIQLVAAKHGEAAVIAVAAEFGAAAAAAMADVLAGDDTPPRPAPGPWVEPAALPRLLLADRGSAVPVADMPNVVAALSLCRPGEPYAGAQQIRAACDRGSFAELGRALLAQWELAGAPSRDSWVLAALVVSGDEETTRTLARLVGEWPRQGGHSRAAAGLDVLAEIGDEIALMELDRIARTAKLPSIKKKAGQLMTRLAEQLELSSEQLADRLVPVLGLDTNGSMALDYGSRLFTVGFDENLLPFVVDAAGHRRANLPRPGAKDDPRLAPAAYNRFATLKADVKKIAREQVRRLEQAMLTGRRWSGREFTDLIANHPLMSHLARRVVWGQFDGPLGTFRLAEDRTLADVDDTAVALAEDALVGIVHPVHVPGLVEAWTEVFSDYEILQPFPQLGRPVFVPGADGVESDLRRRLKGTTVSAGRLLALSHRGWVRRSSMELDKPLGSGGRVSFVVEPGLLWDGVVSDSEQEVVQIHLDGEPDALEASELLADLAFLTR